MALHILAVHTAYAVVRTTTTGVIMRVLLDMFHEIRIFDKHVRYLEQLEAFVHDLLTVVTALHASYVNQRNIRILERFLENLRLVHEIQFLERLGR